MEVICPWDTDENGNKLIKTKAHEWIINYAQNKKIPISYFKQPDAATEKRVRNLTEYLLSPRNFILAISKNSAYMLEIYYYVALCWCCTTGKGFTILDVDEINIFENHDKIQNVDLLIIPYTNPESYSLKQKRTVLSKLVKNRKANRKPFITDAYTKKLPQMNELKDIVDPLVEVYGDQVGPMFFDKNSNAKIVMIGG